MNTFPAKPVFMRFLSLLACASLLMSAECKFPTENPPTTTGTADFATIRVRFLNLASDQQDRRLELLSSLTSTSTASVSFANLSDTIPLTADSARVSVVSTLTPANTLTSTIATRFTGRNAVYTMIALPSGVGEPMIPPVSTTGTMPTFAFQGKNTPRRAVDTVLTLSMLPSDFIAPNTARIRVVNGLNDTTIVFDVNIGCPSGDAIASSLLYRQVSGYRNQILAANENNVNVSLVTRPRPVVTRNFTPFINGTFTLPVQGGQSYALVLFRNAENNVDMRLVNERSKEIRVIQTGKAPESSLRVVNVFGDKIDKIFYGTQTSGNSTELSNFLSSPIAVSAEQKLSTCTSTGRDTVRVVQSGQTTFVSTSFEPNRKYMLLLGRSATGNAVLPIVLPVLPVTNQMKASVRFVNLHSQSVLVQRGASTNVSNEILFSSMVNGEVSTRLEVQEGNFPIIIFSASEPFRLLQTSISRLQAGKSYTYIIAPPEQANGRPRLILLDDNETKSNNNVPEEERGAFVQFVNALSDRATVKLGIDADTNSIVGVNMEYGTSQVSVLRAATYTLKNPVRLNPTSVVQRGRKYMFVFVGNNESDARLLVANGLRDSLEIVNNFGPRNFGTSNFTRDRDTSMYRFWNAVNGLSELHVSSTGDFSTSTSPNEPYFAAPAPDSFTSGRLFQKQGSTTLRFSDNVMRTTTFATITRTFTLRTAYSIFVTRQAAQNLYNVFVLQEY